MEITSVNGNNFWKHNDVLQWKHFPRNKPFVGGIYRSPVNSPHKGQWHGALVFSLICVWINGWVNNHKAGDLRRYRSHYDVIVMISWWYDDRNIVKKVSQTDGQTDWTIHRAAWSQLKIITTDTRYLTNEGEIWDFFVSFNWLCSASVTSFLRDDSRLAPSQWETSLQSNAVSHWLGANLESALFLYVILDRFIKTPNCTVFPMCFSIYYQNNGPVQYSHWGTDDVSCSRRNQS